MELKVWVEGVQRVVCGITEQTTVQEVVIALAQATGRTGRYTLVEKWRDVEKMLPPSEQPLKVLAKWGEYAPDVQFLLKRTGASSVSSSDTGNLKGPERNVYRQSLPPPAKNRDKNDILQGLKRKEPKRKSLTITSGSGSYHEDGRGKDRSSTQNSNSNNNNKVPVMPANKSRTRENKRGNSLDRNRVRESRERTSSNASKSGAVKKAAKMFNERSYSAAEDQDTKDFTTPPVTISNQSNGKINVKDSHMKKKALLPPTKKPSQPRESTGSVSSAREALFPKDSHVEIEARSPIKTNYTGNKFPTETNKPALIPPTTKYGRNRVTSSNSFDTSTNSAKGQSIPISHQHSSSNDTPSKRIFQNNNNNNSLPNAMKKPWAETDNANVHRRNVSASGINKSAMLPPSMKRGPASAGQLPAPVENQRNSFHPALRDQYIQPPLDNSSIRSNPEARRAAEEFNSLLSEQQKHIQKQKETIQALEDEISLLNADMQTREKMNEASLQSEISQLEEKIEQDGIELMNQALLMQQISVEELNRDAMEKEMNDLQSKLEKINQEISNLENNVSNLNQDVQKERIEKEEELKLKSIVANTRADISVMSRTLQNVEEDIKRSEKQNEYLEYDLNEKYAVMDTLNRELRQVDLQQFIRKTGSKITVLPPNTEEESAGYTSDRPKPIYEFNSSSLPSPGITPPTSQAGNSEGVWV